MERMTNFNTSKDKLAFMRWMKEKNLTESTPSCLTIFSKSSPEFLENFLYPNMSRLRGFDDTDRVTEVTLLRPVASLLEYNYDGIAFVEDNVLQMSTDDIMTWARLTNVKATYREASVYFGLPESDNVVTAYKLGISPEDYRIIEDSAVFYSIVDEYNYELLIKLIKVISISVFNSYDPEVLKNNTLLSTMILDPTGFTRKCVVDLINKKKILSNMANVRKLSFLSEEEIEIVNRSIISYSMGVEWILINAYIKKLASRNKSTFTFSYSERMYSAEEQPWLEIMSHFNAPVLFPLSAFYNHKAWLYDRLDEYIRQSSYAIPTVSIDRVSLTFNSYTASKIIEPTKYLFRLEYEKDIVAFTSKWVRGSDLYSVAFVWEVLFHIAVAVSNGADDWNSLTEKGNEKLVRMLFKMFRPEDNMASALLRLVASYANISLQGLKTGYTTQSNIYLGDEEVELYDFFSQGINFINDIIAKGPYRSVYVENNGGLDYVHIKKV